MNESVYLNKKAHNDVLNTKKLTLKEILPTSAEYPEAFIQFGLSECVGADCAGCTGATSRSQRTQAQRQFLINQVRQIAFRGTPVHGQLQFSIPPETPRQGIRVEARPACRMRSGERRIFDSGVTLRIRDSFLFACSQIVASFAEHFAESFQRDSFGVGRVQKVCFAVQSLRLDRVALFKSVHQIAAFQRRVVRLLFRTLVVSKLR